MQLLTLGLITAAVVTLAGAGYVRASSSVETPAYRVEHASDDFEIRQYPELVMAQITKQGSRRATVQTSFSPLARYIFAKDRAGEKIAMTAPVLQEPTEDGWTVSFIMPAGRTPDDLPAPSAGITLEVQPPRRMAVVRFSGFWTDQKFDAATQRLRNWIEAHGLTETAAPEYGYYNDPFTLPAWRRNEVLIEIAQ